MRSLNHMKNTAARNCWAMQTMLFQFGHPIALVLGLMYFLCWTITKKSHFHGKSLIFFFFSSDGLHVFSMPKCLVFCLFSSDCLVCQNLYLLFLLILNHRCSFFSWLPSMVPRVRYQQWKRLKIANKMKVKDKKYALQM